MGVGDVGWGEVGKGGYTYTINYAIHFPQRIPRTRLATKLQILRPSVTVNMTHVHPVRTTALTEQPTVGSNTQKRRR